ncbi:hypothetical protein ABIF63_006111 [Bradyrhizobium japonicum]|uniref:Uncharacterized protein n=1 Tax=Bradyrhizobium japonicum TaxID=375 RepID=A0ABV2S0A9_BRAJP|nr:hypothetical protein [Bradyrhizobium japonicum]MBR0728441.1 hypothetical protein [Bradyrhizobium japonicum]MBR0802613.1 hypothetical protein [Bradyrhizobium japonicum]UQD95057.1 hypothetical protein JEY30_25840 [Bradyrhizobium japonicum]WLB15077.1 hypothetical protein QIH95_23700 [Bradyrhizobium japonicum]
MAFSRPTSGGVQLPRGTIWDGAKDKDAVLLIMGEGPAAATAAEKK